LRLFSILAVAASATVAATPAAAVNVLNFNFGRPSGTVNVTSVTSTASNGVQLTATSRSFSGLPNALTSLSQTTAAGQIQQTVPGIGVCGGASDPQADTNQVNGREAILISGSTAFSLRSLKLSFIDNDDTLQVYGVNGDGSLVNLGYPGIIRAGLAGPNAGLSLLAGEATGPAFASANSGTQVLNLVDPTARFQSFLFTTREPGNVPYLGTLGQGYRIDSLTVGVPEPATWAMLITGFGLVGAARRRQRTSVAA
jgi:hypothetical protein